MAKRPRRAGGRVVELTLAERIALELFTDGLGERVERLALITKTGQDRGGWGFYAASQAIQRVIDDAIETGTPVIRVRGRKADIRAAITGAKGKRELP